MRRSTYLHMRRILRRNPLDIPAQLILDPSLPIPRGLSKKGQMRLAELREAYQWSIARQFERQKLNDPARVASLLVPLMAPLRVEHLAVIPLDPQARAIVPPVLVTRGDVDGTDAGARAIMRTALIADAVQVIIAHNHPSGDPSPSAADAVVTTRIAVAGRAVDVPLVDHLIIGASGQWTSLRRDRPDLWK